MNPALLYLWFALLKRRAFDFVRSLRRPTTLIGFAYVLGLLGVLFWLPAPRDLRPAGAA